MRVRLFNAKFSPNLGDGLLSECLEKALIQAGCSKDGTYSIDVAGRTKYVAGSASRSYVLKLLNIMPGPLRRLMLSLPMFLAARFKWRPHYRVHLQSADAVVIGGGNLFADLDLNFPTKLSILLDEAKKKRMPVFIFGVGVSSSWSERGTTMLRNAFKGAEIPFVAVRDDESKENFDSRFSEAVGRNAVVVRDPGLLISRYVRKDPASAKAKLTIGICITGAVAVRYHSTFRISDPELEQWFAALYRQLEHAGYAVQMFTNGSPEDVESATRVIELLGGAACLTSPEPQLRPSNPSELATMISRCSLVIGFRMHALIAAYSYGSEIIALKWDRKLDSFMSSVGLSNLVVWPGETKPESIIDLAAELLSARKNLSAPAVTEASDDAAKLGDAINDFHRKGNKAN
jgi:polysaccharide pyruvyl transferase WcaK-like protein